MRRWLATGAALTVMLAITAAPAGARAFPESGIGATRDTAVARFTHDVAAYRAMRERLRDEIAVGGPADGAAAWRFRERLRAERAAARAGDIFTPDVTAVFRTRIWQTLTLRDLETLVTPPAGAADALDVNDWCAVEDTRALPAVLAAALPRLPSGLAYRISGTDLVLLDVDAGLVVDLLTGALAPLVYV